MKVVHNSQTNEDGEDLPLQSLLMRALDMESDDAAGAISQYRQIIRRFPLKEKAYDRLMIIFRKEKSYKEEIALIDQAVKTFNDHFGKPSVHAGKRKVASLSKSLQKSLGLTAGKKDILSSFQPIARWQKRRALAAKRAGVKAPGR